MAYLIQVYKWNKNPTHGSKTSNRDFEFEGSLRYSRASFAIHDDSSRIISRIRDACNNRSLSLFNLFKSLMQNDPQTKKLL